jgi:hypothetical protein
MPANSRVASVALMVLLTSTTMPTLASPTSSAVQRGRPHSLSGHDQDVQAAYNVARQRPELLAQLPCYCGCMVKSGHRNSLDCFKTTHAAECNICIQTALDAARLADRGISLDGIRRYLRNVYTFK